MTQCGVSAHGCEVQLVSSCTCSCLSIQVDGPPPSGLHQCAKASIILTSLSLTCAG